MVHSNYQVSILTKSAGVAAPPQLTAPSTAALCKTKLEKRVAAPWGLHDETRLSSPNHSAPCIQEPPIYWPRGLTSGTCPLLHKSIKPVEHAPENTLSVTSSFPFPLTRATAPLPGSDTVQMQGSISQQESLSAWICHLCPPAFVQCQEEIPLTRAKKNWAAWEDLNHLRCAYTGKWQQVMPQLLLSAPQGKGQQ